MSLKILEPFSDELLKYDFTTNRYELTMSITKTLIGNPFKDDAVLQQRIKKNSLVVYNYIYSRGNSHNKKYTEFILNNTKQGRLFIYKCLESQIMADALSGYNDLGDQNLIDLNKGQVVDRNKIIESQVSVNTQLLIENSQADLCGYNVLCLIAYNIPEIDRELSDDNK